MSQRNFKYAGKSFPRPEIAQIATATHTYAVDAKVPGMVHARNVRPPVSGAKLVSIDESSVSHIPGFIKVVSKGNYVAVVCEREEHAIQASQQLKVTWEHPAEPVYPGSDNLYDYMRKAPSVRDQSFANIGNADEALARAAKVVEASYEIAFQGHVAFGPAHAMADPRNGEMTIYSNAMKAYGLRTGVSEFLGIPRDQVRVIWQLGPQAYGRSAAGDVGIECAYIAHEIGRPVRLQWMRHEETGWDTKGPAYVIDCRGGLDAQGNLIAYRNEATAADYNHEDYENNFAATLGPQLMGVRKPQPATGGSSGPDERYNIPNKRYLGHVVALPIYYESPLRTGNLRDPNGPQKTFASESFIDECAAAAGADPVQFRLKLLTENIPANDNAALRARHIGVIRAAAEAYGWDTRPSPKPLGAGPIVTGRGIAYVNRGNTVVATIAEVEVNLETGYVRVKRFVCAHDCGFVVNPNGLENVIQGNLLHSTSRALYEEVKFDQEKVTVVDWITYPILRHQDVPDQIDIVIVNNSPDFHHDQAGEPSSKPTAAAIANAIFDATGVRVRKMPMTPARVKAALDAARA